MPTAGWTGTKIIHCHHLLMQIMDVNSKVGFSSFARMLSQKPEINQVTNCDPVINKMLFILFI
jgi:hypothetical protein